MDCNTTVISLAPTPSYTPSITTPSPASSSASSTFHAQHYLSLFLLSFPILFTFYFSITSLYALVLALILTAIVLCFSYLLLQHKPITLPLSFLLTHATFGLFIAPVTHLLLTIPCLLTLLLPTALLSRRVVVAFLAVHPKVATFLPQALTNAVHEFHVSKLPLSPFQIWCLARKIPTSPDATHLPDLLMRAWAMLRKAGVSRPAAMAFAAKLGALALVALGMAVIIVMVLAEIVRWRLFQRHADVPLPRAEGSSGVARVLGVRGLTVVGCTGALSWVTCVGMYAVGMAWTIARAGSDGKGYGMSRILVLVMATDLLLGATAFVGSQLVVATAYAERVLLGSELPIRKARLTSVMYNVVVTVLGVPLVLGLRQRGWIRAVAVGMAHLRAVVVWRYSRMAVQRARSAVEMEKSLLGSMGPEQMA